MRSSQSILNTYFKHSHCPWTDEKLSWMGCELRLTGLNWFDENPGLCGRIVFKRPAANDGCDTGEFTLSNECLSPTQFQPLPFLHPSKTWRLLLHVCFFVQKQIQNKWEKATLLFLLLWSWFIRFTFWCIPVVSLDLRIPGLHQIYYVVIYLTWLNDMSMDILLMFCSHLTTPFASTPMSPTCLTLHHWWWKTQT